MKANEAPEKIWINSPQDLPCGFVDKNSVEYTRTDAFVEKVAEYLSYHLDTSKIDVNYKFDFIEDLKKAMKLWQR